MAGVWRGLWRLLQRPEVAAFYSLAFLCGVGTGCINYLMLYLKELGKLAAAIASRKPFCGLHKRLPACCSQRCLIKASSSSPPMLAHRRLGHAAGPLHVSCSTHASAGWLFADPVPALAGPCSVGGCLFYTAPCCWLAAAHSSRGVPTLSIPP